MPRATIGPTMAIAQVTGPRGPRAVQHAVILAAGEGRRLGPLTRKTPKVMLPIDGKPLLEHLVTWCRRHGVRDIYVNLYHAANQIVNHFRDGEDFGVTMHYLYLSALRPPLMDIHYFSRMIPSAFYVLYGDVATVVDLSLVAADHLQHGADATIVVRETDHPHDSDLLVIGQGRRIQSIIHKGEWDGRTAAMGNVGCYVLEPTLLETTPYQGQGDFMDGLFEVVRDNARLLAHQSKAWMLDIGTPERYARAQREFPAAVSTVPTDPS